MKISKIKEIANKHRPPMTIKKEVMDEYESLDDVKVLDSAFPIDWSRAVTEHFHVRNIGSWAWAYGQDKFKHGIPVPCNTKAWAYFESMYNNPECHLIYTGNYENDLK